MRRYLVLFAYFVRFSVSRSLEFRFDFFFRVVMDCVYYVINFAFFGILYNHVDELAGLNKDQAMLFVAAYVFVDAMNMTLFSNNTWWLPTYVNRGDLDYHLVRPVSSLFFLSLRDFATNSFLNLLITIGILTWALANHPETIGAASIIVFVLLLLVGVFINYCLLMAFIVPVFWTHSAHGLRILFFSIHELSERPHQIFPTWGQRILLSIFPAACVASLPTVILVDDAYSPLGGAIHMLAVAAAAFAFLVFIWNRGLRVYSSASS